MQYKEYFGFKNEPFSTRLSPVDLLQLPNLIGVHKRVSYGLDSRGIVLLTGEVGSGKSTALRWACAQFHTSEVLVLPVLAQVCTFTELLKSIATALGLEPAGGGKSKTIKAIKSAISELSRTKRQKVLLTIDECHLLKAEVFAELHTLTQFDFDSENLLTIVLCGLESVHEKLRYRNSGPLASRIIAKSHLQPLNRKQMEEYLLHHQRVAGLRSTLFDEAVTGAIFQGSGGIPRKANLLARGTLIAASQQKVQTIEPEHVRIAASELI